MALIKYKSGYGQIAQSQEGRAGCADLQVPVDIIRFKHMFSQQCNCLSGAFVDTAVAHGTLVS